MISRHHSKIDDFRTRFIDKFDNDDELEKELSTGLIVMNLLNCLMIVLVLLL